MASKDNDVAMRQLRDKTDKLLACLDNLPGFSDEPPYDEREFVGLVQRESRTMQNIADTTAAVHATFRVLGQLRPSERFAMIRKFLEQ